MIAGMDMLGTVALGVVLFATITDHMDELPRGLRIDRY